MRQILDSLTRKASGHSLKSKPLNLHSGELVEVRSEREIRRTLDGKGEFEGLQFSPEMAKYCGERFRVFRRADKLIIEGIGMRRMKNTVILAGVLCDGLAHRGCKKTCLLLWKETWLRTVPSARESVLKSGDEKLSTGHDSWTESKSSECQASSLKETASALPFWDIRQYKWDIESGAFGPFERLQVLLVSISNGFRKLLRSEVIMRDQGHLRRTPTLALNLQPGEYVYVRSREEIMRTLDTRNRNRGLGFTQEMSKYCGGRYKVLKRVDVIKDEKTGDIRQIVNTVLLDGVTCDGKAHGGCPRNCFCLWREIWLRRATDVIERDGCAN